MKTPRDFNIGVCVTPLFEHLQIYAQAWYIRRRFLYPSRLSSKTPRFSGV